MAEIIAQESGGKKQGHKRRPKKHSTRIDMTPMVDLMCLLITFFMLTTAFSKPKVMEITMPEKNNDMKNAPKVSGERTLNIILTANDKVYWYKGIADPNDKKHPMPVLTKTDFSKDGIRKILLKWNQTLFEKIEEYREKRIKGELIVSDTLANQQIREWKKEDKKGPVVLIKADDKAKYKDVVNIVDEMAICNIASYAIVDISPAELKLLETAPK